MNFSGYFTSNAILFHPISHEIGYRSATEDEEDKNSSTATTPKNSKRTLTFDPSGDVGNSGCRYAHWESHPHKKRPREGDDGAGGSGTAA